MVTQTGHVTMFITNAFSKLHFLPHSVHTKICSIPIRRNSVYAGSLGREKALDTCLSLQTFVILGKNTLLFQGAHLTANFYAFQYQSAGSSLDSDTSHQSRRRLNMPMMYQMYESQYEDLRGTVYGPNSPDFQPAKAGEKLRSACSGLGILDFIFQQPKALRNQRFGHYQCDRLARQLPTSKDPKCL